MGSIVPQGCLRHVPTFAITGRATGLLLALFGTIIDSCEALVVRRMGVYLEDWHEHSPHGDMLEELTPRMVIFYKYLFTASFTLIGLLIVIGARLSELRRGFKAGPRHILAAASCQSFISMLLTLSLLKTETATVYLLYLLAPLWAALFGRFFLKEPIRRCTALALLLAACSVALMKLPTIIEGGSRGAPNLGDLYAVAAGGMLGCLLTISRSAALHVPNARMVCAPIIGSSICVLVAATMLIVGGHSPIPGCGGTGASIAFIALGGVAGFTTAVFYVCALLAAKYITGAEVGLVKLMQSVVGPFWVYVGLGEVPSHWTFIGGSLLLLTLFSHALFTSNALPLDCTKRDRFQSGTIELRRVKGGKGAKGGSAPSSSVVQIYSEGQSCSGANAGAGGPILRSLEGGGGGTPEADASPSASPPPSPPPSAPGGGASHKGTARGAARRHGESLGAMAAAVVGMRDPSSIGPSSIDPLSIDPSSIESEGAMGREQGARGPGWSI